jgi:ArsR family transcriptional regulator, arsenate/arsenite/antimonite-responsive transcriptional repressor
MAIYFDYSRTMEMFEATEAFASLAQETRLKVFKLLIEYGRDGVLAGKIAEELKMPPNTLSFHLSHMARAGLVTSRKEGRSVTYLANAELIEGLIDYLQVNCCARETRSRKKSCNERKC